MRFLQGRCACNDELFESASVSVKFLLGALAVGDILDDRDHALALPCGGINHCGGRHAPHGAAVIMTVPMLGAVLARASIDQPAEHRLRSGTFALVEHIEDGARPQCRSRPPEHLHEAAIGKFDGAGLRMELRDADAPRGGAA